MTTFHGGMTDSQIENLRIKGGRATMTGRLDEAEKALIQADCLMGLLSEKNYYAEWCLEYGADLIAELKRERELAERLWDAAHRAWVAAPTCNPYCGPTCACLGGELAYALAAFDAARKEGHEQDTNTS